MKTLLTVAFRNLTRNRKRTAITLAALVMGVGIMVFLRGFIDGQQQMMKDNIAAGRLGGVQVHKRGYLANILSTPISMSFQDTPELRAKILSVKGVVAVAPRIEFGAMLSMPDKKPPPEDGTALDEKDFGATSFFMATAIDPEVENKVTWRRVQWLSEGAMIPSVDSTEVVLNNEFARGIEAKVQPQGSPLPPIEQQAALLAPDRDGALNGANVVVGGVYGLGSPGDKRTGLVPLKTAQQLLRMEGEVTEYALRVEPLSEATRVRAELQALLGDGYEVHTWDEVFPFMREMMGTQDFIFGIVARIFLLVVLLGIVNAMLMSVLERVREIGTMLAVGMKRRQIVGLFLLEGMVLGFIGGVLGLMFGVAVTVWAGHVGIELPAPGATVSAILRPTITAGYLVEALVQAVLGATIAALWPAFRASALRPVEALQAV
jgi:putative ABC transport system permease protein